MSIVTLVSGGLDSTLMAVLVAESKIQQLPLFLNYGQIFYKREYEACLSAFKNLGLPRPTPNRNLMFLVCGTAFAHSVGAVAVAIGLLNEQAHLFPDQTKEFLRGAESLLSKSIGHEIHIVAPLMGFNKAEVVALARDKGITKWYSCHSGKKRPCGRCISCQEYNFRK